MIWGGNCCSGDIGGYDIDRDAKLTVVSADIDVWKINLGDGSVPVKWTGEQLLRHSRKIVKESARWDESKNMFSISFKQSLGLSSPESRKSCLMRPMNKLP